MQLSVAQIESVELASTVKQKLVEFALSPPFEKHLRRLARELAQEPGELADPGVDLVERLLFSFTYDDGSTIIDRFLRRPGAAGDEQEVARGFLDGVDGIFEMARGAAAGADVFQVRCCLSDLLHMVAPTLPEGIPELQPGSFLIGRLNPIAATELWTPSGMLRILPPEDREAMATTVLDLAMRFPAMTHRNPEKLRQARARVAETHRAFVARHGSDRVLTTGQRLPQLFAEAMMPSGDQDGPARERSQAMLRGTIETSELIDADHVLLHSHPVAGLGFYRDFDSVARALESGVNAREEDIEILHGYIDDSGIPAWLLRELITERLPAAELALARAIGQPDFDWQQDGEEWLASLPGDPEPMTTMSIVPSISEGLSAAPGPVSLPV